MTEGSVCSGMPTRSRLVNTPAICPRSLALPVSFSTIEARIRASLGVRSGSSPTRASQAASRWRCIVSYARLSTVRSLTPRLYR